MKTEKRKLAGLIKTDKHNFAGDRFGHVNVGIKAMEDESIRNGIYHFGHKDSEFIDGLTITCQASVKDNKNISWYAYRVEYKDSCGNIDLPTAKRMYKTLTRIKKGLQRLSDNFGNPDNYPEYVLRVFRVLKIKHLFESQSEDYVSSYDEMDFLIYDEMQDIRHHIAHKQSEVEAWLKS